MFIKTLENTEVSSVIFIRDYLQFYFEGEQINGTNDYIFIASFCREWPIF
ncbi:hypothetical protein QF028_003012 [Neobacillus sp. B4I6]|jgi:hypothetical protein